jgi:hypothetical protein
MQKISLPFTTLLREREREREKWIREFFKEMREKSPGLVKSKGRAGARAPLVKISQININIIL